MTSTVPVRGAAGGPGGYSDVINSIINDMLACVPVLVRATGGSDVATVQAAIDAESALDVVVVMPDPAYVMNGALDLSDKRTVKFSGHNDSGGSVIGGGTVWHTKDSSVYTITVAPGDVTTRVVFDGITVDGTNGNPTLGQESTTWPGLFKNTKNSVNFMARDFEVLGSALLGAVLLDFTNCVWVDLDRFGLRQATKGKLFKAAGSGQVSTTVSFRKGYFTYALQIYEIGPNVTDVNFEECEFESSSIVGWSLATSLHFKGGGSENIGYADVAHGLDPANLAAMSTFYGSRGSARDSAKPDSAFTDAYSTVSFDGFVFSYLFGGAGAQCVAWFDPYGRSGGNGSGGSCQLRTSKLLNGTAFFRDEDALNAGNRSNYALMVWDGAGVFSGSQQGKPIIQTIAQARLLTYGIINVAFSDGSYRTVEVKVGQLELGLDFSFYTYTASAPAYYPTGSAYVVGDRIRVSAPAAGGWLWVVCTTAGAPGTWKAAGAIAA